jgi:glycosyltransferase involved in cell wall biosynthesis
VHGIAVHRFRYAPAPLENLTHEMAVYDKLRRAPWRYAQVPVFLAAGVLKARALRRLAPDIVHVHWPIPLGVLARPFRGATVVFHYHQTELSLARKFALVKRLYAPVLERARIHLCNSSFTREQLLEIFGPRPAAVVPMPYAWRPPAQRPEREPDRVLFVGRMSYWKGGDLLIRACGALVRRGCPVRLVMVGDGPERAAWENLTRELGVTAEFKGWKLRDELMAEYGRAAVCVLPSRFDRKVWVESLGVVLLEAMACGTAVIASRMGGPRDLIRDGENGRFFAPGDADDLAEKLAGMLTDFPRAVAMGQRGLELAAEFSPEAIARRLDDIYAEARRATPAP